MTELYKITDEKDQTKNSCQWGENVTVETSGKGEMCDKGFTHWHTDPRLAVIFNPIHGNFDLETAHLWKGEGEIIKSDGLKIGCKKATTLRRIEIPQITMEQKISFAIHCALKVYKEESFVTWAKNWLSGKDRSKEAAYAAWDAAADAAWAADAAADAAWAADAAADAADAARVARAEEINFIEIIDEVLKNN